MIKSKKSIFKSILEFEIVIMNLKRFLIYTIASFLFFKID